MGCKGYIQPHYYYKPDCHDHDATENELKNINNIKIDVVCPGRCKPKPVKTGRNKLVNINNITVYVDGHKVKQKCW